MLFQNDPSRPLQAADTLLTPAQICAYLDISLRTFRRWRSQGDFPLPDFRIGKTLRWRKGTIDRQVGGDSDKAA